jgi:membrane-bound lytic murein transglycosylase A
MCGSILFGCYFIRRSALDSLQFLEASSYTPSYYDDGDSISLATTLRNSVKALSRLPPESEKQFGLTRVKVAVLIQKYLSLLQILERGNAYNELQQYIRENFVAYRTSPSNVLFTAYFEASLRGSRKPSEMYQYPLFKVPHDLVKLSKEKVISSPWGGTTDRARREGSSFVPYYTRAEILFKGALSGKGAELLWIDSLEDTIFLQIQGSGVVSLEGGGETRVNFAERNGHPYKPIGRFLVEKGLYLAPQVSMATIRDFLHHASSEREAMISYDPSFVFFREVEEGPLGALGVPVTPGRSLAMDRAIFPDASLIFMETTLPTGEKLSRFVSNQDAGGAIKGPQRADYFTGRGHDAETLSGPFRQNGTLYFLVPRPISLFQEGNDYRE